MELFRILALNSNELMLTSIEDFLEEIEISQFGIEIFYKFPQIGAIKEEFVEWYKSQHRITATINNLSTTEFDLMKEKLTFESGGGSCYNNSQRVVFIDPCYSYVEGFINTSVNPGYKLLTQHAFNCNKANELKDYTLKPVLTVTPNYYSGIVIPQKAILELLEKIGVDPSNLLSSRTTLSLTIPFFLLSTGRMDMIVKQFYYPASQLH